MGQLNVLMTLGATLDEQGQYRESVECSQTATLTAKLGETRYGQLANWHGPGSYGWATWLQPGSAAAVHSVESRAIDRRQRQSIEASVDSASGGATRP